jgi:hypothetical protein
MIQLAKYHVRRDRELTFTGFKYKTINVCLWVTNCKRHNICELAGLELGFVACTSYEVASRHKDFVFGRGDRFGESFSKCFGRTLDLAAWLTTFSAYCFGVWFTLARLSALATYWFRESFALARLSTLATNWFREGADASDQEEDRESVGELHGLYRVCLGWCMLQGIVILGRWCVFDMR